MTLLFFCWQRKFRIFVVNEFMLFFYSSASYLLTVVMSAPFISSDCDYCYSYSEIMLRTDYMSCLRQLLYPSEEDLYKLVRFLVERLSEPSEGGRLADVNDVIGRRKAKGDKSERHWEESTRKLDENGADIDIQKIGGNLDDLRLISEVMDSLNSETGHAFVSKPCDVNIIPQEKDEMTVDDESRSSTREFNNGRQTNVLSLKDSIAEPLVAGQDAPRGEETAIQGDDKDPLVFEKKVASSGEQSSKVCLPDKNMNFGKLELKWTMLST